MILTFENLLIILVLLSALMLGYRLMWALAHLSEQTIVRLVRMGLHAPARGLLAVLIGYDDGTYQKSRFIIWNQVRVRFAFLWGSALAVGIVLFLLGQMHLIRSVLPIWLLLIGTYLGYRCMRYWVAPAVPAVRTTDPALQSLIHDVNERLVPGPRHSLGNAGRPVIRQWDYLDELFAKAA